MTAINLPEEFYPAYKKANGSFNPDTFLCAEETVEELLKKATTSEHPGMLLGKVQSGKTRTFISILALAFDNDFDIAIVLSKNSRSIPNLSHIFSGAHGARICKSSVSRIHLQVVFAAIYCGS